MNENANYDPVKIAVERLKRLGFSEEFNVKDNCFHHSGGKIDSDGFIIVDIYRCEGNPDPAEEAVVYAIESYSGVKGIFVSSKDLSSDSGSEGLLHKLRIA